MNSLLRSRRMVFVMVLLVLTIATYAQAPNRISYQAVIRNSTDQLVVNQQVGMRISIQKYLIGLPPTYQNIYVETHTPSTNDNGLVSLQIGSGTVIMGSMDSIRWGDGTFYIKTETDPTGGTTYSITATTRLLSVPYALHAQNVKTYKVGDYAEGGVVFWVDETGQHGLVCAITDQDGGSGLPWQGSTTEVVYTQTTGDGIYSGRTNTPIIVAVNVAKECYDNHAALVCSKFTFPITGNGYGDWYLPSKAELNLMYQNRTTINATALAKGGAAFQSQYYWSSTEALANGAWAQSFSTGNWTYQFNKMFLYRVRAIRSF